MTGGPDDGVDDEEDDNAKDIDDVYDAFTDFILNVL